MHEQLLNRVGPLKRGLADMKWSSLSATSGTNLQYASAVVDDTCYLFGGRVGLATGAGSARSTAYKFKDEVFTPIRALPKTLVQSCAVAIGRKIYILGGTTALASGNENKQVIIYDVDADTYSYGTDCPVNSLGGDCAAIGTDIYLYGGLANQTESGYPAVFRKYDTVTQTWSTLTYHDGAALYDTLLVALDGKLYAFGGEWNNANSKNNAVRCYDPVAGAWETLTVTGSVPSARAAHGGVWDEENFVIVGGRTSGFAGYSAVVYSFNIKTKVWTRLADYPTTIGFEEVARLGNFMYGFEGYSGSGISTGTKKFA